MAAGYLAASLELGARQAEQAKDLEQLSRRAGGGVDERAAPARRPGSIPGRRGPKPGCTCSPSGRCARNAMES